MDREYMKRLVLSFIAALVVVALQARPVTGKVHSGRTPLMGVIVTDGTTFVKTDASGCFTIDVDDAARFVSIVTPSGYNPNYSSGVPAFYKPLTKDLKSCDFNLRKMPFDSKDYDLIVISDPQCKTPAHFKQLKKEIMPDVIAHSKSCAKEANTACIILGDLGWDSWPTFPKKYPSQFKKMGIPVYSVIGNHDFNRNKVDLESWRDFENLFGPVNFAFYIGDALVIGLKDIDYNTNKKYKNGYTDEEVNFVKGLMEVVPPYTKLYVAQHCPIYRWFDKNPYIRKADQVIEAMKGRDVTFLSGHTHMANFDRFNETMVDVNPAALSSSIWYFDKWNNDGTPRGYFIFRSREGKVRRDFHAIDLPDAQKVEFFHLGQSMRHPNSIVVNAWNADENWKFEWFQDGQYMGRMQQDLDVSPSAVREWVSLYPDFDLKMKGGNGKKLRYAKHYYIATPSQYAKTVRVMVTDANGSIFEKRFKMSDYCDVQAHRGGAGRKPEDTIVSMKYAQEVGVNTLELDVWLSKDKLPVVSHDSWFHTRLATRPDGTTVGPNDPKEYLYTMPYDSIAKYDVGLKVSEKFPVHESVAVAKPLLEDLVDFCENYAKENGLDLPRYNIEIKYKHAKGEGVLWPEITENINITLPLLISKNLGDRLVIQCFDPEGLNYIHEHYPELKLSYLTDEKKPDYAKNKAELNFTPEWISPHYSCVTKEMVEECHKDGTKIVPWTVDEPADIRRMMDLGCDAVITNYPDRMLEITRGYVTYVTGNENEINLLPR